MSGEHDLPPHVAVFFDRLPPETRRLVAALRDVVRRAAPLTSETLLWAGLSYHRPWIGGRVKGSVCQIVVCRGDVRLDFIHGVRLPDPSGLLQVRGASKRCVHIATAKDVARPAVARLIRAAADVNPR